MGKNSEFNHEAIQNWSNRKSNGMFDLVCMILFVAVLVCNFIAIFYFYAESSVPLIDLDGLEATDMVMNYTCPGSTDVNKLYTLKDYKMEDIQDMLCECATKRKEMIGGRKLTGETGEDYAELFGFLKVANFACELKDDFETYVDCNSRSDRFSKLYCSEDPNCEVREIQNAFQLYGKNVHQPLLLILFIFLVAIGWVSAYRYFSKTFIFGGVVLCIGFYTYLGVWLIINELTDLGIFFFVIAGLMLVWLICRRKVFQTTAGIAKESIICLLQNKFNFVFIIVWQAIFLVYWFLYASSLIKSLGVTSLYCSKDTLYYPVEAYSSTKQNVLYFQGIAFLIIFYVHQTILRQVISMNIADIWFITKDPNSPKTNSGKIIEAFKIAITSSLGSNVVAAVIQTLCKRLIAMLRNPFNWIASFGIVWCLKCCLEKTLKAYVSFVSIAHSIEGQGGFFTSAKRSSKLLWNNLELIFTTIWSVEMAHNAVIIFTSYAIGFIAWNMMDAVTGVATFGPVIGESFSGGFFSFMGKWIFLAMLIFYCILINNAMMSVYICVLLINFDAITYSTGGMLNGFLSGVFIASLSKLILSFFGYGLESAIYAGTYCYSIEKEGEGGKQHSETVNALYEVLDAELVKGYETTDSVIVNAEQEMAQPSAVILPTDNVKPSAVKLPTNIVKNDNNPRSVMGNISR